jgi:hypothetical protein
VREKSRPLGLTIFAVLLGISALGHLARISPESEDLVRTLTVCVVLSAFAAAVGLWRRESWALTAFVTWSMLVLARQVARELRVDQVPWEEVLLGFGLQATVLGFCVAFVRSQLRDSR